MKKHITTLTAFLLLFALITNITPVRLPSNLNTKSEISVCGDDDEGAENVIRKE